MSYRNLALGSHAEGAGPDRAADGQQMAGVELLPLQIETANVASGQVSGPCL